jgi:hypothetical protein
MLNHVATANKIVVCAQKRPFEGRCGAADASESQVNWGFATSNIGLTLFSVVRLVVEKGRVVCIVQTMDLVVRRRTFEQERDQELIEAGFCGARAQARAVFIGRICGL